MEARVPANERERLEALRGFEILDTAFEETFDRATRLAAHIMDAPISVVSFVDEDRQWFKSVVGLDAQETPRSLAFCSHAILDDEVMIVEDATEDPRFNDNPLVVGDPNIRFYAGAPLIVEDGLRLGTLCVIDRESRTISDQQRTMLRDLARVVTDELWLRKSLISQERANRLLVERAHELQLANESLEQYAYMASHDLRAPLKRLINVADLLIEEPGEAASYLPMIRRSAIEMEDLVVGYRRLSMLQRGRNEEVMVADLIDQAKIGVEPPVTVEREGDAVLVCDPTLLLQVFVNLFANAQKYGSGPIRCEIEDATATDDSDGEVVDRVRIRVSNPVEEDLRVDQSLFAPFRRLTSSGDGRGLGLAILDRIVKIHSGTAVASCVDAVFSIDIILPARKPT